MGKGLLSTGILNFLVHDELPGAYNLHSTSQKLQVCRDL